MTVAVAVESDLEVPVERFDEVAALIRRLDPQALRGAVADDCLESYNDTWRQDDDEELDRKGFVARVAPTHVDIARDFIEVYVNDGELFVGHSIIVSLDMDLRITDVRLAASRAGCGILPGAVRD